MSIMTFNCLKCVIKVRQFNEKFVNYCSTAIKKQSQEENLSLTEETLAPQKRKRSPSLGSKVVLNYLDSREDLQLSKSLLPPHLLKVHRAAPESLYLVSNETAKHIIKCIGSKLEGSAPIVEINPGYGCLTQEILNSGVKKIKLFEISPHNENNIINLQKQYQDKLDYTIGDFLGMWKLAFQDRLDGGSRVKNFLKGIESKSWEDGVTMKIIAAMSSLTFIRHLILGVVFQEHIISMGRPELFISIDPYSYHTLVPIDSSVENNLSRPIPVLFDALFQHKLLSKIPRRDFLPWQINVTAKTHKKAKLLSIDKDYLYLVQINVKPKLPCSADQLPLLWYFFKIHLTNKTNRIIPMLEQWIPGCGVWLITNQNPPGMRLETSPTEDDCPLPHITIFTQFRDLTSAQKITLFKKFVSFPEFEHCPFQEMMENHLSKSISTSIYTKEEIIDHYDETHDNLI